MYLFNENGKGKINYINVGIMFILFCLILMVFLVVCMHTREGDYLTRYDFSLGGILCIGGMGFVLACWFISKPLTMAKKNTYLKLNEEFVCGVSHTAAVSKITGMLQISNEETFHEKLENISSASLKKVNGENIIVLTTKSGKEYNIIGIESCTKFIDTIYSVMQI